MKKRIVGVLILVCIFCLPVGSRPVQEQPQDLILGVNAAIASMSVSQQNAILAQLHAAGVRYIRSGILPDDRSVDFARRAQAQGIGIDWLVELQYRPGAPSRPWPNAFSVWGGPPLSAADPDQFRKYFEPLLAKLDAAGVTLAGFELGNEINSPMFNADFSLPAENPNQSKEFNLWDLSHDPEARQVAKGYLQYLKLLAVIKDVRSRSKLNRHTLIVSAGLVFNEAPDAPRKARLDAVSAAATLDFMRAGGLDTLVDVYGVHTYPWTDNPGNPSAAAGRRDRLQKYVLSVTRPPGSAGGKPCWITEWGIPNHDTSCPPRETDQIALVNETRSNLRPYIAQKRVLGLFYYAWLDPREGFAIYRCGHLTETGRLALAPF
ncbi:glycoside hydrolase family protein [Dinghuibacter silviterrae]|uniref:Glycosyl hydrolase n=1 Tax=Dinghuibacter silviterrae TaxID=1539049 RepID=A0A4R8DJH1_9BACT|nr:hypothetical protein [Dinghuibacter silviterrae]TDW97464.1 hypothetical protein EDB95_5314 [Dinghuibacter silviterrae]